MHAGGERCGIEALCRWHAVLASEMPDVRTDLFCYAHKKSPVLNRAFYYCLQTTLLTCAWAVVYQSVAHVGMEVLQRLVLIALRFVGLGTDLLVTAAVATMQCTQTTPF
jgi:hypothetical protein